MIFLLCTGTMRRPTLSAEEISLSPVSASDPVLAAHGVSGEDWYKLETEICVNGSAWSPYEYESAGFEAVGDSRIRRECEHFLVAPDTVLFSKAEPARETVAFYVRYPAGEAQLRQELGDVGFGLRTLDQKIGFFRIPITDHIPALYVRELALPEPGAAA